MNVLARNSFYCKLRLASRNDVARRRCSSVVLFTTIVHRRYGDHERCYSSVTAVQSAWPLQISPLAVDQQDLERLFRDLRTECRKSNLAAANYLYADACALFHRHKLRLNSSLCSPYSLMLMCFIEAQMGNLAPALSLYNEAYGRCQDFSLMKFHIGHLCEFARLIIEKDKLQTLWPILESFKDTAQYITTDLSLLHYELTELLKRTSEVCGAEEADKLFHFLLKKNLLSRNQDTVSCLVNAHIERQSVTSAVRAFLQLHSLYGTTPNPDSLFKALIRVNDKARLDAVLKLCVVSYGDGAYVKLAACFNEVGKTSEAVSCIQNNKIHYSAVEEYCRYLVQENKKLALHVFLPIALSFSHFRENLCHCLMMFYSSRNDWHSAVEMLKLMGQCNVVPNKLTQAVLKDLLNRTSAGSLPIPAVRSSPQTPVINGPRNLLPSPVLKVPLPTRLTFTPAAAPQQSSKNSHQNAAVVSSLAVQARLSRSCISFPASANSTRLSPQYTSQARSGVQPQTSVTVEKTLSQFQDTLPTLVSQNKVSDALKLIEQLLQNIPVEAIDSLSQKLLSANDLENLNKLKNLIPPTLVEQTSVLSNMLLLEVEQMTDSTVTALENSEELPLDTSKVLCHLANIPTYTDRVHKLLRRAGNEDKFSIVFDVWFEHMGNGQFLQADQLIEMFPGIRSRLLAQLNQFVEFIVSKGNAVALEKCLQIIDGTKLSAKDYNSLVSNAIALYMNAGDWKGVASIVSKEFDRGFLWSDFGDRNLLLKLFNGSKIAGVALPKQNELLAIVNNTTQQQHVEKITVASCKSANNWSESYSSAARPAVKDVPFLYPPQRDYSIAEVVHMGPQVKLQSQISGLRSTIEQVSASSQKAQYNKLESRSASVRSMQAPVSSLVAETVINSTQHKKPAKDILSQPAIYYSSDVGEQVSVDLTIDTTADETTLSAGNNNAFLMDNNVETEPSSTVQQENTSEAMCTAEPSTTYFTEREQGVVLNSAKADFNLQKSAISLNTTEDASVDSYIADTANTVHECEKPSEDVTCSTKADGGISSLETLATEQLLDPDVSDIESENSLVESHASNNTTNTSQEKITSANPCIATEQDAANDACDEELGFVFIASEHEADSISLNKEASVPENLSALSKVETIKCGSSKTETVKSEWTEEKNATLLDSVSKKNCGRVTALLNENLNIAPLEIFQQSIDVLIDEGNVENAISLLILRLKSCEDVSTSQIVCVTKKLETLQNLAAIVTLRNVLSSAAISQSRIDHAILRLRLGKKHFEDVLSELEQIVSDGVGSVSSMIPALRACAAAPECVDRVHELALNYSKAKGSTALITAVWSEHMLSSNFAQAEKLLQEECLWKCIAILKAAGASPKQIGQAFSGIIDMRISACNVESAQEALTLALDSDLQRLDLSAAILDKLENCLTESKQPATCAI